jgi:hypothetical protein
MYPTPNTTTSPPLPLEVRISEHAVKQFRGCVRPTLHIEQARGALEQLVALHGDVVDRLPVCARDDQGRLFFILVGDSVALPLAGDHTGQWAATSSLAPGTLGSRDKRDHRRKDTKGPRR